MHKLLTKWLGKRGISSPEELDNTPMPDGSPTERETFEEMRLILNKKELKVDDIKEFCSTQLKVIENKWANYDVKNAKKAELIPYHNVYRTLIAVIEGPDRVREQLEEELTKLTK